MFQKYECPRGLEHDYYQYSDKGFLTSTQRCGYKTKQHFCHHKQPTFQRKKSMPRIVHIMLLTLTVFVCMKATAQEKPNPDTILVVNLKEAKVTAERHWLNDTVRYRYNQTKYYVSTVLPYVWESTKMFQEINKYLQQPGLSKKERKKYIDLKEAEVRVVFDDQVKQLNTTQGVLLIKLIARQSGLNVFEMLQNTKGGFSAFKLQTWARVQGFNLNKRYQPDEEPMLEHIMEGMGHPLPPYYGRVNF